MAGWREPKPAVLTAIMILRAALDSKDTTVAAGMPRVWKRFHVRVTRAGGGQDLIVTDTARLLVECYADSPAAAEVLTNKCRAALHNATGHRIDLGSAGKAFVRGYDNEVGPVEFPDVSVSDRQRWQFQGDLLVSTN